MDAGNGEERAIRQRRDGEEAFAGEAARAAETSTAPRGRFLAHRSDGNGREIDIWSKRLEWEGGRNVTRASEKTRTIGAIDGDGHAARRHGRGGGPERAGVGNLCAAVSGSGSQRDSHGRCDYWRWRRSDRSGSASAPLPGLCGVSPSPARGSCQKQTGIRQAEDMRCGRESRGRVLRRSKWWRRGRQSPVQSHGGKTPFRLSLTCHSPRQPAPKRLLMRASVRRQPFA